MGQQEILQALKNLGGKAFISDLRTEYYELMYPSKFYGKNYMQNKTYDYNNLMRHYMEKMIREKVIRKEYVMKPYEEYDKEVTKARQEYEQGLRQHVNGLNRKKILITLLPPPLTTK